MKSKLMIFALGVLLVALMAPANVSADPCLTVYPSGPCFYHYLTNEYHTVTVGDPLYDPAFDRGGEVLIETALNAIDPVIYQAPGLLGFVPTANLDGYFSIGENVEIIVDAFEDDPAMMPHTYTNVLLVFQADPADPNNCDPQNITVDGNPVTLSSQHLDHYYVLGDITVTLADEQTNGNPGWSVTETHTINWSGCPGINIWAFADENFDAKKTGNECFSAFSHDVTIPTKPATWGAVKELYKK